MKTNLKDQAMSVTRIWITTVLMLWMAAPARTAAQNVLPGWDLFVTPAPTQGTSSWSFASSPLPAGFFDPGSDPFDGVVQLRGEPLGSVPYGPVGPTDTIVQRTATAVLPGLPSSTTVPIEIVALNLVSCNPITVTYGPNPPQQWDLRLTMNDTSTGSMFINHNVPDGGTFSSSFVVRPTLTFTRHGDLAERETTRIDNLTTGGVQWSYDAPHNAVTVPETSNFFPGGTPGDTFGTVQQFRYQGGQFTWDLHLTVPEPSTDLLMMAGVAAFLLVTRRFK